MADYEQPDWWHDMDAADFEEFFDGEPPDYTDIYAIDDEPGDELARSGRDAGRIGRWSYDDSGYYAYFLFDGPSQLREQIKPLLAGLGLSTSISGPSHSAGSDGVQYQWFLRVPCPPPCSHEKITSDIKRALVDARLVRRVTNRNAATQTANRDLLEKIRNFASRLEQAKGHASRIERDFTHWRDDAEAELGETKRRYAKSLRRARKERDELRQEADSFRAGQDMVVEAHEWRSKYDAEVRDREELEDVAEKERQEYREVKGEIDEVKRQRDNARRDCENSEIQRQAIREELDAAKSSARRTEKTGSDPGPSRGRDDFEECIRGLLPQVRFLHGSFEVMRREYQDYVHVLNAVGRICGGDSGFKREKLRGTKHWFEVHVNNGYDNAGRLYYRSGKSNGESVHGVLVSWKTDQKSDVKYLKQNHDGAEFILRRSDLVNR